MGPRRMHARGWRALRYVLFAAALGCGKTKLVAPGPADALPMGASGPPDATATEDAAPPAVIPLPAVNSEPCERAILGLRARSPASPKALSTRNQADVDALSGYLAAEDPRVTRLEKAMKDPVQVATADAVARLVTDESASPMARALLELRFLAGIRGGYLDALDAAYLSELRGDHDRTVVTAVYSVKAHLERRPDNASRECLVDWATGYVRLKPPLGGWRTAHEEAWWLLVDYGRLRDGDPLARWIDTLGEPTLRSATEASWLVKSPRHVNPGLTVTLADDKVRAHRFFAH